MAKSFFTPYAPAVLTHGTEAGVILLICCRFQLNSHGIKRADSRAMGAQKPSAGEWLTNQKREFTR
jgi:hypothetical protein